MSFLPFHHRFPEVAKQEGRSATLSDGHTFHLLESYCTDRECDCRRVMFLVHSDRHDRVVAHVNYGWESLEFYKNWGSAPPLPGQAENIKGPALAYMQPTGPDADAALLAVQGALTPDYVERLKRHYAMATGHRVRFVPDRELVEARLEARRQRLAKAKARRRRRKR